MIQGISGEPAIGPQMSGDASTALYSANDKTVHTGKSFRNLFKSNRNQIVFTIVRLIWN